MQLGGVNDLLEATRNRVGALQPEPSNGLTMTKPILHNAFVLLFDTRASIQADPMPVDGEALMTQLSDRGMVAFSLKWGEIFDAQLAIEDDVIFICNAASELSEFVNEKSIHYVHLGDGELELTSSLLEGVVSTIIEHTPHLDTRFHRRYQVRTQLSQYLAAWHSLVDQLQKMAHERGA